ncbi:MULTISPECIES: DUF3833 family protein [unclassified Brevundimonas]|uniref:DUF3833 family protein n=1 Tax=unclassified Brevundimonas TaxID=2622653 RepID=UPI0025C1A859|nr:MULTISPECIES: DUF3833 family protein [unclassified Brevundimonas]
MNLSDFADTTPEYRPEIFLNARLEGWGVLERITGGLQQRFTVRAQGRFDGETLEFSETWSFDDGHVDRLNWRIRPVGDGRYVGDEDRLDGQAEGDQAGCAFHWRYSRDVPQKDGSSTRLNFNDWFYRIDETAVMAKGAAGRLGVPFATVHVLYRRLAD